MQEKKLKKKGNHPHRSPSSRIDALNPFDREYCQYADRPYRWNLDIGPDAIPDQDRTRAAVTGKWWPGQNIKGCLRWRGYGCMGVHLCVRWSNPHYRIVPLSQGLILLALGRHIRLHRVDLAPGLGPVRLPDQPVIPTQSLQRRNGRMSKSPAYLPCRGFRAHSTDTSLLLWKGHLLIEALGHADRLLLLLPPLPPPLLPLRSSGRLAPKPKCLDISRLTGTLIFPPARRQIASHCIQSQQWFVWVSRQATRLTIRQTTMRLSPSKPSPASQIPNVQNDAVTW